MMAELIVNLQLLQKQLRITENMSLNKLKSIDSYGHSDNLSEIIQQSHLGARKPSIIKQSKKQPPNFIRPTTSSTENMQMAPISRPNQQHQFLQMYDENIQLKNKQTQLNHKNQQLESKIADLKGLLEKTKSGTSTQQVLELVKLKKENRELNKTVSLMQSNRAFSANKSHVKKVTKDYQKDKIQDLLRIIDHNKKSISELEAQLKVLQRQNYVLKQQAVNRESFSKKEMIEMEHESKKQRSAEVRIRQKQREFELAREKVGFLEAQISRLQVQLSTQNQDHEINDLRAENRRLEDNLRRLSESPAFRGVSDKVEQQTNVKALQSRCKALEQRHSKDKEKIIQMETELKLTQSQMVEAAYESQQLQKQNRNLKEKVKENPIVDLIAQDEETLFKVVGFLKSQNFKHQLLNDYKPPTSQLHRAVSLSPNIPHDDAESLKKRIEVLITEKEVLAVELHRTQGMLKAIKQSYEQRQRIHGLEERARNQILDQKQKKIRDLQVVAGSKAKNETFNAGVRYEDSVSVFSSDDTRCETGFNYFDIYLGNIVLVQNLVKHEMNISDAKKLITFLTVDFYNHNTENSKLGTGVSYNVNTQFSFKITEDSFFMNFLEKGYAILQLWSSEGTKAVSLGTVKIGLKPMIIKSRPHVAPVVNSSSPIYLNNKAMGTLNYVMRMRAPLSDQFKEYKKISALTSEIHDQQQLGQAKKLVVNITQGKGLRANANSFVYYCVRMTDYYTNTHPGSNPIWDHWNIIDILFNQDFKNYLRNGQIEFTVLDDNAPLNDSQETDLVGSVKIPLTSLLEGNTIDLSIPLRKGTSISGEITIKIFWYDKDNSNIMGLMGKKNKKVDQTINLQDDLTDKINKYFKKNKLEPETAFRKFDNNGTGVVSKSEFQAGLINIGIRVSKRQVDAYFHTLDHPVDQKNFNKRFFPEELAKAQPFQKTVSKRQSMAPSLHKEFSRSSSRVTPQQKPIVETIKQINQFMQNNTVNLKRITLQEFLKGKQDELLSVALQIDQNNDGSITRPELQKYFDQHGIDAHIQDEKVDLMQFLKKYSSKRDSTQLNPPLRSTESIQLPRESRVPTRKLSKKPT